MRGLQEIVEDNRTACQRGVVKPGELVGTSQTKVYKYTVTNRDGVVLATGLTDIEVALKFNQIRSEVVVEQEA